MPGALETDLEHDPFGRAGAAVIDAGVDARHKGTLPADHEGREAWARAVAALETVGPELQAAADAFLDARLREPPTGDPVSTLAAHERREGPELAALRDRLHVAALGLRWWDFAAADAADAEADTDPGGVADRERVAAWAGELAFVEDFERTWCKPQPWADALRALPRTFGALMRALNTFPGTVALRLRIMLAAAWPAALREWRRQNAVALAARAIIRRAQEDGDDLAGDAEAEGLLQATIGRMHPAAAVALGLPVDRPAFLALGAEDGMFVLDARLLRYLGSLPDCRSVVASMADHARAQWAQREQAGVRPYHLRWLDDPTHLLKCLAIAAWQGGVRPGVERRREHAQPVLSQTIMREIGTAAGWWDREGRTVRVNADRSGLAVVTGRGEVLAEVPTLPDDLAAIQRAVAQLASLTGHRVLRDLAARGHRQYWRQAPDPALVVVPHGLQGYAEELGMRGGKARGEVLNLLRAGHVFRRTWPGTREVGGLWTYDLEGAAGRCTARLEIRLGSILLPSHARRLDNHFGVPVVPLPPPPAHGRVCDRAAQAAFQVQILMALVERREELARYGGARLEAADFARMAARVGLPPGTIAAVLDRWTKDGDDGPACLERTGEGAGCLYNLPANDAYRAARDYLMRGGERTLRGRASGQRGAEARARLLDGHKGSPGK